MVGDVEELDILDALEVHARRLNEKEVLIPNNGEKNQIPCRRWITQVGWKRSGFPTTHVDSG